MVLGMPHCLPETKDLPALSVIVCTRDRLDSLKQCVAALAAVRTEQAWELVVVDNASSDGTAEYLGVLAKQALPIPKLTTTLEPKRGLAAARNTGWRSASANLLAFTDDDCYVASEFVDSVIQVFAENYNYGFCSGRILLFDDRDYPVTIQESEERVEFLPQTFLPAGAVQGANLAFRKEALERIGGFDERLGAGTPFPSEDVDAAAAALWAGFPGVYDPRPVVFHDHGRRTDQAVNALRASYDAGRGAYYAKNIWQPRTRAAYLKAWGKSIRRDLRESRWSGRLPLQSIREVISGARFTLRL